MGKLLAFGEVLFRMSPPGRELLLQSARLDVWLGGAEANVATALARLGHDVALATCVPDNDLGRAAISILRGNGVDTNGIRFAGTRIGLYFVTPGAGMRATDVTYDRVGSSFSEATPDSWDWDALLAGVDRLHLSGITPALGPLSADAALAAVDAAEARNIPISFDGNYRAKLWQRWNNDPRPLLRKLMRKRTSYSAILATSR
jgi:2-dehydro-3-deoxygluconokinase